MNRGPKVHKLTAADTACQVHQPQIRVVDPPLLRTAVIRPFYSRRAFL